MVNHPHCSARRSPTHQIHSVNLSKLEHLRTANRIKNYNSQLKLSSSKDIHYPEPEVCMICNNHIHIHQYKQGFPFKT